MNEWVETTLGEISIGKGAYGIAASAVPFDKSKFTYLRITDIRDDGSLDKSGLMSVDDPEALRYVLHPGDLVIARTGASTGRNYFYDGRDGQLVYAGFLIKFSLDPQKVFPPFVKYHCLSQQYRDWIASFSNGSTRGNINAVILANLPITLPPLPTQRRISAVLSALDDKIELNNRINANLEAQAQALFRSWFVDFEPWGGTMPEGWREGKLGDWVEIKRGGSPRPIHEYISTSGYRWLKISDVTTLNSPFVFQTKECIKESGLPKTVFLREGALVLSNSATPGIPKILCVDSCIHDGWLYFPRSSFSTMYLYLFFNDIRPDLVNLGNGSIFTNLKTDILKEYKVVKPDVKTLEHFDSQVQPLFAKQCNNERQILALIEIRDTLLPKLMSGEIDVSQVEIPA